MLQKLGVSLLLGGGIEVWWEAWPPSVIAGRVLGKKNAKFGFFVGTLPKGEFEAALRTDTIIRIQRLCTVRR